MDAPIKDRRRRHSPDINWGKPIRQVRGGRYYGGSKCRAYPAKKNAGSSWSPETQEAMGKILDSYFPPEDQSHRCNAVSTTAASVYTVQPGDEEDGIEEEGVRSEPGDTRPGAVFIRRSNRLRNKARINVFDPLFNEPSLQGSQHDDTIAETSPMPSLYDPNIQEGEAKVNKKAVDDDDTTIPTVANSYLAPDPAKCR